MIKFTPSKTGADAKQAIGTDWAKIIKCDGGYLAFATMAEYKTWIAQK
jgi:hypothetical protein